MKVGILAGGHGTRLAEETEIKPKPMVEIGGRPILWHIMMHYSCYGHNEFVIALGYKGEVIKRYMVDYCSLNSNLTINLKAGRVDLHDTEGIQDWTVELIDTGLHTMTGGRIKRLQPYMGDKTFMLTWGDGVSTVDLARLLAFHRHHGRLITMTAVRPPARYGHMEFDGDDTQFEKGPLERLAADGELMAYKHDGFWQCMDTRRDKFVLEKMWDSGEAPWKTW